MQYSRFNMLQALIGTVIIGIINTFQNILIIGVVLFAIVTLYILLQKVYGSISEVSANVLFIFSLLMLVPYLNVLLALFMYTEILGNIIKKLFNRGKK